MAKLVWRDAAKDSLRVGQYHQWDTTLRKEEAPTSAGGSSWKDLNRHHYMHA